MQKNIKKVFSASIITLLLVQMVYIAVEPSTVIAASNLSDSAVITLNVDAGISITSPADATMSAIAIGTNTSIGTAQWTVVTNNTIGYKLDVKASASPALVSGVNSFADYTETSAGVPETWSVASLAKEFGYSAWGTNTVTGTWGAAGTCGSGSTIPAMKYEGFAITDRTIATAAVPTAYAGVATNICFAAEQNGTFAPSGTYTATITATATTL